MASSPTTTTTTTVVTAVMVTLRSSFGSFALLFLLLISTNITTAVALNNAVLSVKYKYAGRDRTLSALKAHDTKRTLRFLAGVDLPLGGSGRPDAVGLYYAKIGIGTPARDYYVQVDTGSDIMWVNCIQCKDCPERSSLGIELSLYDIKQSSTGKLIPCNQDFCLEVNGGPLSGCTANMSCPYLQIYGDGSSTAGYFVKDFVLYDRVSGDLKTTSSNGSVIFGCGATQSGDLGSSGEEALDGILGFGKSNSSIISQLASSGKVKKMFAHCLDGKNGGGIFAIGRVVQPKVNMTPLVPNQPHYNVNMKAVQVGRFFLNISTDVFEAGDRTGTIIDSGTTLAYLPDVVYEPLVSKIFSQQPDLKVHTLHGEYKCFEYSGSVDDGFPAVTFYFENSLSLNVYPHDYLFPSGVKMEAGVRREQVPLDFDFYVYGGVSSKVATRLDKSALMTDKDTAYVQWKQLSFSYPGYAYNNKLYASESLKNPGCHTKTLDTLLKKIQLEGFWCIGWQNSGMQSSDRKNLTLLGDLVLSNKLVLYDLENQVIGWTEYNCSSSIKVQDEQSGTVHLVGSHYISSACHLNNRWAINFFFLTMLLYSLLS